MASTPYRADIDGLRAIAVLAVVGFHAFPGIVRGGFVGVDIFFVISGFLITSNLAASLCTGTQRTTDFYARRIRRIFPSLIVVLLATYAIGWPYLFATEFAQLGLHIAAGAAFAANLVLQQQAGYFDDASDTKPLLHLWSLGVEEQFYIVWPVLFGFVWTMVRRPVWALAAIGVASFAACVYATTHHPVAAFYSPLFRCWELAAGATLACVLPSDTPAVPAGVRHIAAFLGIALLAVSVLAMSNTSPFPGWWAALPVAGAMLTIASGPDTVPGRFVWSNRMMVGIGLISYPLYLWHWPLLTFARILDGPLPSRAVRLTLVAVSIALAGLTYRSVERPLKRTPLRTTAVTLLVAMAGVAMLGYATYARDGLRFRAAARASQPYLDSMQRTDRTAECFDIPFAHSTAQRWFCHVNRIGQRPRAMVFGDSYALSLMPAVESAARSRNVELLFAGFSGCPPLLGVTPIRADQETRNCHDLNERVFRFVRDEKIPDVFLVANWTYYTDGGYSGEDMTLITTGTTPPTRAGSREAFASALAATIARYQAAGIRLHVVQKVPAQLATATDLVRALLVDRGETSTAIRRLSVPIAKHHQLLAFVNQQFAMQGISATAGGRADLVDLDSVFCDADVCPFADAQQVFYTDAGHLSTAGALRAAPILADRLR